MAKQKKSWHEKLHAPTDLPKTIAVPAPLEVDALMKKVRRGRVVTINELRAAVARRHGATEGCPMTTGIFAWIAAHAADEELRMGKKRVTPYWRTLKADGELNPKYPGGVEGLKSRLEGEGHRIVRRGKGHFVEGYEKSLQRL